ANQLARYLSERGVGANRLVGLCAQRSLEMVVGILGILKAGGAYVPLDPGYPPERLKYLLTDSAPVLVLRDAASGGVLDERALQERGVELIELQERQWSDRSTARLDRTETGVAEHALAYVIYTSGSTGAPKGVMVEHRAIARLAVDSNYATLGSQEVMLQMAPLAFDASTFEVWGALLNGGKLAIAPNSPLTPELIREQIRRYEVTTLWLTASLFNVVVDEDVEALSRLRQLLAGGDVLSPSHMQKGLRALPQCRMINGYGPTENTTFSCCYSIPRDHPGDRAIPIGHPIANTQVYILDEWLEAVPAGIAGEIYLGGAGLARGYLGQPGLTAQRFVANPYGPAGGRLYRTGDIGRWNAQGQIEFLGRNDQQVKIRGYRIELGEIEAQLLRHPQVKEAVVLAREGATYTSRGGSQESEGEPAIGAQSHGSREKRLVAYYVASGESAPEVESLRSHLQQHLPEYMVPAAYVCLEQLPLTANGKLDRRALPGPTDSAYGVHEYEAPVGELEQTLASIWQELLQVERVGRRDNFFELGGHSLLVVQLISRVRERVGVELGLREVFEHGSVAGVASALKRARQADQPPIPVGRREGALVLSLGQQRLWFLTQLEGASAAYHITQAVRLRGQVDRRVLREVLDRIVQRHEVLRTRFVMQEGQPQQQIEAQGARFRLREEDLSAGSDGADGLQRRLRERVEAHGREGFDLQQESGVRGLLVRLGEKEHVLAVTMHHIVSDGWSMGVLIREFTQLYGSLVRGE